MQLVTRAQSKLDDLVDIVTKLPVQLSLTLCLLSGVIASFIQAPYNVSSLIFPCFGLFYILYANSQTIQQSLLCGFTFAFGYFVASLYWIGNALLVDGNPYVWAWPLAVMALPALLAAITTIYIGLAHILFPNKTSVRGLIGFCALLALAEWTRGHVFTGFPWNLYGHTWDDAKEMIQIVSFGGPYILTFLTILWGCSAAFLFLRSSNRVVILSISILSLIVAYEIGHYRLFYKQGEVSKDTVLHIVQPNIQQENKWDPQHLAHNFEQHIQHSTLTHKGRRNIIIWPETAVAPPLLGSVSAQERIQNILDQNSILISGALIRTADGLYHNGIALWDHESGPFHLYSKTHLVPFGEYIPFQEWIPLKTVTQFSGFAKGDGVQTIQWQDYPSFRPLICYESIFANEVTERNQSRPDYLLVVTNDAWYGDSPGPYQHFSQAKFRAVEQGIPVVRSANTGISGVIDSYGIARDTIPLMQDGGLSIYMPLKTDELTYYSRFGDYPFFILMALCFVLSYRRKQN